MSRDNDPSKNYRCTPVALSFHPLEISAPRRSAKGFCSFPEVVDSLALPAQQDWEMKAVASLFQAHGHTAAHDGSISLLSCPHLHIPEHSEDGVIPTLALGCSVVTD